MDSRGNQKREDSESCPFRRFIGRNLSKEDVRNPKMEPLDSSMASTSGYNGEEEIVRDESALLSLHPWIFKKESYREGVGNRVRGSIRSRRRQRFSVKPVDFRGNYISPFVENVVMEEYVLGSPPSSPARSVRPFVVTDGSRIISRSNFDSFGVQRESGLCGVGLLCKEADGAGSAMEGDVVRVPSLSGARKSKRKSSDLERGKVEATISGSPCKVLQLEGSHEKMLPLFIGISIGMISALAFKRTEVEKLNKLLKQTENLVQDLQEELDMKDTLTVRELASGNESQNPNRWNSETEEHTPLQNYQNPTPHLASTSDCDCKDLNTVVENSDSLSNIEAELEAELERLEQTMNACSIKERMSDISELDPDLVANLVQGELRADILAREPPPQNDTSTTSTDQTYNANYSVSPRELSLRLHQVIQSRLEERVEELERELHQSQSQLQAMEAERASSQKTSSISDVGCSSNQESPRATQPTSTTPVHPFWLNLTGDALTAYDEAYEEFMLVADKNEKSPFKDQHTDGCKSNSSEKSLQWEETLWSQGSFEEEEGGSSDDEAKTLIRQLVEKTKQGSLALRNAQRMFLLMDEEIGRQGGFSY